MRHLKKGRKLNRSPSHRRALIRNMVTSLLRHDRITTTDAKAQALSFVQDKEVVARLFRDLAPRFQNRNGGYTRVVKVRRRRGDCAPLSVIELVLGEGVTGTERVSSEDSVSESTGDTSTQS
jgi:large subunit ribosomal protein L17